MRLATGRLARALWALAVALLGVLVVSAGLYQQLGLAGLALGQLLFTLLPTLLAAWEPGGGLAGRLALRRPSAAGLVAGLASGLGLALLVLVLLEWQQHVFPVPEVTREIFEDMAQRVVTNPLVALASLVVVPALVEEVLFRGLLLGLLLDRFRAPLAVLLSAALFSFLHLDPYRLAATLLAGIALGTVVLRTGSVYPAMLLHMAYNAVLVFASGMLDRVLSQVSAKLVAGGVLVGLGLLLLWRRSPASRSAAAALVLALLSGGCGGPDDPGTRAAVMAMESAPRNLDPRVGSDAASQRIGQLIHARLLARNASMLLEGDLAQSWERPQPELYVFHLRRDATFHDGRPVAAADVVWTYRSLTDGTLVTARRRAFRALESVEAADTHTVVFRLEEPSPSFLSNLSLGIVPRGSGPEFRDRVVGAGPFKLVEQDERRVVLERHEGYHGRPAGLPRLVLRVVPDATVRALELRKGSVDLVMNALPFDLLAPLQEEPALSVRYAPGITYYYVGMNLRRGPLSRRAVRQALASATDRETIIRTLFRGHARPALGPLAPENPFHEPSQRSYPYDPDAAKRLLDEAGYVDPDGPGPLARIRLGFKTSTDAFSRLQALVLQDMWRRVGVEVELRSYEFGTFFQDVLKGDFELYSLRWVGVTDPDFLEHVFHSGSAPPEGANRGGYANARVDALLEAARVELDPERRHGLYAEVQRLVAEEVPYVSLYYADNCAVLGPRLSGLELWPTGAFTPLVALREGP